VTLFHDGIYTRESTTVQMGMVIYKEKVNTAPPTRLALDQAMYSNILAPDDQVIKLLQTQSLH